MEQTYFSEIRKSGFPYLEEKCILALLRSLLILDH